MIDPPPPPDCSPAPTPRRELPFASLISAALFLYVGFGLGQVGVGPDAAYNASVTVLVWMARVVGVGLLAVAALELAGVAAAALLDAVLAGLAAGGCLAIGAIWIAHRDTQGYLLLVFALVNASAAFSAWQRFRLRGAGVDA